MPVKMAEINVHQTQTTDGELTEPDAVVSKKKVAITPIEIKNPVWQSQEWKQGRILKTRAQKQRRLLVP